MTRANGRRGKLRYTQGKANVMWRLISRQATGKNLLWLLLVASYLLLVNVCFLSIKHLDVLSNKLASTWEKLGLDSLVAIPDLTDTWLWTHAGNSSYVLAASVLLSSAAFLIGFVLMRMPRWLGAFFRSDAEPSPWAGALLGSILFIALVAVYFTASYLTHLENPADKVVPSLTQILSAAKQVATVPDRSGIIPLWSDLAATSWRFAVSLAVVSTGIIVGLMMGIFPYFEALAGKFVIAIDKVVALAMLPLLMLVFGIDEGFRVALVALSVYPTVVLSAQLDAKAYPEELKTKARTIGASHWELAFRVVLPGIMPKMLDTLRLNFKSIAGLVITSEMIVADAGLGYRINAVRHFMAMDIVIVYVAVVTLLLFAADLLVTGFVKLHYPWFNKA